LSVSVATVTGLAYYPLKGGQAVKTCEVMVGEAGIENDRKLMLKDRSTGGFISQRDTQKDVLGRKSLLTQISAEVHTNGRWIWITIPGQERFRVSLTSKGRPQIARLWKDDCSVLAYSAEINARFSQFLGRKVALVRMADGFRRLPTRVREEGGSIGFADGAPLLFTNETSLEDLNRRLGEWSSNSVPLEMERFRTNVTIKTTLPWEEDTWTDQILVNRRTQDLYFVGWGCARCVIPSLDPKTGYETHPQLLRFLAGFRKAGTGNIPAKLGPVQEELLGGKYHIARDEGTLAGVIFGLNIVPLNGGRPMNLRVGDEFQLLTKYAL